MKLVEYNAMNILSELWILMKFVSTQKYVFHNTLSKCHRRFSILVHIFVLKSELFNMLE